MMIDDVDDDEWLGSVCERKSVRERKGESVNEPF